MRHALLRYGNALGGEIVMSEGREPLARLLGADLQVPVWGGGSRRYINLDNAATTPPLERVWNKLAEVMPWYGSIHRGAGYKSLLSTHVFEESLKRIHGFCDGDYANDVLILGVNTTSCANHLARRLNLSPDSLVITSELEHTSNLLPWRKHASTLRCRTAPDGLIDLAHLESILKTRPTRLVAVTAASNVTGIIVNVHAVAALAHRYGAQIFVDAAQFVAHRKLDRRPADSPEHLDYVAFSGHKMYAPFGVGVLIGDRKCFSQGWPDVAGGGTIRLIDGEEIVWAELPGREQGGTPNMAGVVGLAEACATLEQIGFEQIEAHERALTRHAQKLFPKIKGSSTYRSFDLVNSDSVAVFPFSVSNHHHSLIAAFLGVERGIGVRAGHLCQHELVRRFLSISEDDRVRIRHEVESGNSRNMYGVVRASCGIGTTTDDLDALVDALVLLAERGTEAKYHQSADGEYHADGWAPEFTF
jgi:cysteine desulfurase/selenocysteine lyase